MLCRTQFIQRKWLWCLQNSIHTAQAVVMFGFCRSSHLSFRRLFGQNNVPQMFTAILRSIWVEPASQLGCWGWPVQDLPPVGRPKDRKPSSLTSTTALLTMDRCSAGERTECASHTQGKAAVLPKPATRFPTHHTPSVLLGLSFPYLGFCFQFLLFKGTLLHEQRGGKL